MFVGELDHTAPRIWQGVERPGDDLVLPTYLSPNTPRAIKDMRTLLEKKGVFPLNRETGERDHFVPGTWNFGKVALGDRKYDAHIFVRGIVRGNEVKTPDGHRVEVRFYATSFPQDQILAAVSTEQVSGWSGLRETVIRRDFSPEEANEILYSDFDDQHMSQPAETAVFQYAA